MAGVVDPVPLQLRQGPTHHVQLQLRRQGGEGGLGLSSRRLTVVPEAGVVIGTAEHLRQNGDIRLPGLGFPEAAAGGFDVFRFVRRDGHLNQRGAHGQPSLSD